MTEDIRADWRGGGRWRRAAMLQASRKHRPRTL